MPILPRVAHWREGLQMNVEQKVNLEISLAEKTSTPVIITEGDAPGRITVTARVGIRGTVLLGQWLNVLLPVGTTWELVDPADLLKWRGTARESVAAMHQMAADVRAFKRRFIVLGAALTAVVLWRVTGFWWPL